MATRVYTYVKTSAPSSSDDSVAGYSIGDNWTNTTTDITYKALDVSVGAAIWATSTLPSVVAVTISATPAINVRSGDIFTITSQNTAITSMTTNLTGTPVSGQKMMIEILDDGTARAITWGASFASGPSTLPATTTSSKWLYVGLEWSASRSKWICLAEGSEQ